MPQPRTSVRVSFDYEELTFDLAGRVVHSETGAGGLRFTYRSDAQRDAMLQLITRLAEAPPTLGLSLIPVARPIVIF